MKFCPDRMTHLFTSENQSMCFIFYEYSQDFDKNSVEIQAICVTGGIGNKKFRLNVNKNLELL